MAQKTVNNAPRKSVQEVKQRQLEFEKRVELFESAQKALQFLDLKKTQTRSYTIFDKEKLRRFMKNPKANEKNLRNLSRFLYRVSMPYKRLINYNAQQMDLTAMSIIPLVDFTKDNNMVKVTKNYYDTCKEVEKDNLQSEIYKCLITAWVEDCCYAYVYEDEVGMYLMVLDGDYCKISSTNYDGSFNFAFDFSYFGQHLELLDFWDEEFKQKYNFYKENGGNYKWQELDPEKTFCIKVAYEDPGLSVPPYLPLFEAVIDDLDLQSLQSVKNKLQIYKLLVARLETNSNTDQPDDFLLNPATAVDYFYKAQDSLPEEVDMILSPMPIDAIDFKDNSTDTTDMIAESMSNLFKISGGSLVLNDEKTGASIYRAHQIADMMVGLRPLLSQVEVWHNRHLTYVMGEHAKIKYMYTSPWLKDEKKKELISSAQYGVPVKLAVAALDGFSPLETLSMQFLENDILKLHEDWVPLQSSYTQSSDSSNESDDTLTDEGENTKEQEKNKM